ncbi:hypothetical protein LIER_11788 [Lithospermum erythrorhizon]|uniref:Uncharacterized protein n=1 Tax=Lithospermum erythrorhizon TaxID=34254 RepID=A0AAV3PQZ1_LITER
MSNSRLNWYLRPVEENKDDSFLWDIYSKFSSPFAGDSGFETDSETEVVPVKCPVLILEYVHDQGDGDMGGVVVPGGDVDGVMGPGENLEGLVGFGEDVDRVVGPERDVDGVVGPGEAISDLDSVPELGDEGNLRRPEIDEDILYGKELDNFDNDELE